MGIASFNMISIDGDTSTNDTVLFLANGLAENAGITEEPDAVKFEKALEEVCTYLARCIARDGEGATRLIEVSVEGARTQGEARAAARTVVSSPLVKSAVHGCDPNWGRVVAAVGRSGVEVTPERIDVYLGDFCLMEKGRPLPFDKGGVSAVMARPEVPIRVHLNLGTGRAIAWGCDLSEEYVTINSEYTT